MAESRGVAHLSRDLVNKLVGIVTDTGTPPQRRLDRATATLDRLIRETDSPAAEVRHAVVAVLDDAISTVEEHTRTGGPGSRASGRDLEPRVRAKIADGLAEVPGLAVEGRR
jgi:hypothetical protein